MLLWLFITIVLLGEEFASSTAVFLVAYHAHINIWIIHGIWLVAVIVDILVGYALGKYAEKSFATSRFEKWMEKSAALIEKRIGTRGESFSLIVLGFLNFPYVNSFAAAWLTLPFWEMFFSIFIGSLFWYIFEWMVVIGIITFVPVNLIPAVVIALAAGVLLTVFFRQGHKKWRKKHNHQK